MADPAPGRTLGRRSPRAPPLDLRLLVEGGAALLSAVLVTYGAAIVLLARAAWRRSMGPTFVLAATVALLGMSGLDNVLTRTEVLPAGWS